MNDLFSIPVKSVDLSHIDIDSIKKYCLSKTDNSYHQNSNEGGHHSKYFDINNDLILQPLCKDILNVSKQFCDEIDVNSVTKIQNMWCILNKKGHYNREHIHAHSFLSGVFYPGDEYPDGCGDLSLVHPSHHLMNYDWDHKQKNYNKYNSLVMNIKPKRGMLLLFPSFIPHFVHINKSNSDRLVISFNIE